MYRHKISLRERLLVKSHPEPNSGCWVWLGAKRAGRYNYGIIKIGGKRYPAHRVSYEEFRGPIPPGLVPDHLCDTPICINPWHLEVKTDQENLTRGIRRAGGTANARKTHCKNGHVFDHVDSQGERRCRICQREKNRRWKVKTNWNLGRRKELERLRREAPVG